MNEFAFAPTEAQTAAMTVMKALSAGFFCSMRFRQACVNSTGEISFLRKRGARAMIFSRVGIVPSGLIVVHCLAEP